MTPAFWKGRTVLVTGHTGFKGAWLTTWLSSLGAHVFGYSLAAPTSPSLFDLLADSSVVTTIGDVNDLNALTKAINQAQPEIVFHLAAQSLVRPSYVDPVGTYLTNVMGTVHVLEAIRHVASVRAAVIVTSDKCYENDGRNVPFTEEDAFGGHDPYSNSKGCAELVTAAYRTSFFAQPSNCAVASARAGNVIGGGDWSMDRLIPDVLRAHGKGETLLIRAPDSTRPWQHVLDPLAGYLDLGESLLSSSGHDFAQGWNFGPDPQGCLSVRDIIGQLAEFIDISWRIDSAPQPPEAHVLRIDSSKAKQRLKWRPRLSTHEALRWTAQWHIGLQAGTAPLALVQSQIATYEATNVPSDDTTSSHQNN